MKAKKKEEKKITISIELENDLYFELLKACYEQRITIDAFVEKALREYLKKNK